MSGPDDRPEALKDLMAHLEATASELPPEEETLIQRWRAGLVIQRGIGDPGAFTPRGDDFQEPLLQWGARAVLLALRAEGFAVVPISELLDHADGNVGDGCWDLHDRYAAPSPEVAS